MSWRLASRLSVVTLAALVVVIVALWGTRGSFVTNAPIVSSTPVSDPSGLLGTYLGEIPAPGFQLADQLGQSITLAQFKGKPVVLTFLYTHCPDACPLTAEKLHQSMLILGSNAQKVGVIVISTDPKGDTPLTALSFTNVHHMQGYWHYLLGTHAQLSPVWASYAVDATLASPATPSPGGTVTHTTAVYVLDQQGRERVFLGGDFTSAQLATDLQLLLS